MTTEAFQNLDEGELCGLAGLLTVCLRSGDTIALRGELGAGKTTFARALIRALANDPDLEVPSPTFTLVQAYEASRFSVAHLDFYRLQSPDEVTELGLDESLGRGIAVIEWPERATNAMPSDRLEIEFAEAADSCRRHLRLIGRGSWSPRLSRFGAMQRFLARALGPAALGGLRCRYLQGDASARAYARIAFDGSDMVLMDSPRMPDGPAVRDGLPYSRVAHLAEEVMPFLAVAGELRRRGLSAPEIYASDLHDGFCLIEDLGDLTFGRALELGADQPALWTAAVDVLVALRRSGPPSPMQVVASGSSYVLPVYDRGALAIETELLLDWYWPEVKGAAAASSARASFGRLWASQFNRVLQEPKGWVLRDFHSPNLMWRPDRRDLQHVGVLDFQDAVQGPWAFDLMSLLQDARLEVPASLEREMLAHYCRKVAEFEPDFDAERFAVAYAVLGAQRNTKIIGIFARLWRRDGKSGYLPHIPRIWRYLERNLAHPALGQLRDWYDEHFPPSIRTAIPSAC
jgi:tRNA threonylcarbamoyl adenosine modification protein YjeE